MHEKQEELELNKERGREEKWEGGRDRIRK